MRSGQTGPGRPASGEGSDVTPGQRALTQQDRRPWRSPAPRHANRNRVGHLHAALAFRHQIVGPRHGRPLGGDTEPGLTNAQVRGRAPSALLKNPRPSVPGPQGPRRVLGGIRRRVAGLVGSPRSRAVEPLGLPPNSARQRHTNRACPRCSSGRTIPRRSSTMVTSGGVVRRVRGPAFSRRTMSRQRTAVRRCDQRTRQQWDQQDMEAVADAAPACALPLLHTNVINARNGNGTKGR